MVDVQERRFNVNGYQLAAREWCQGAEHKVIALHGWLDNAASFDVLAPLLSGCHLVCLDLSGHGLSDHKQSQASYHIWDDLLDILAVADELGWQTFHLLGHSRGAIMSVLLCASMPERVESIFLLDAVFPPPFSIENTATNLGKYLKGYRDLNRRVLPCYDSIEEAVAARCRSEKLSQAAAEKIVRRGLKQVGDQYAWVTDPRLTVSSAFRLSDEHIDVITKAVFKPAFVLLASEGVVKINDTLGRLEHYPNIPYQLLPGGHHFHLEEQANPIAGIYEQFLLTVTG